MWISECNTEHSSRHLLPTSEPLKTHYCGNSGRGEWFRNGTIDADTENKKLYIWKIKGKNINPIFNYQTTKLFTGFRFPADSFPAPYSQAAYDGGQIMHRLQPPVQPVLSTDYNSPQAPYNPAFVESPKTS